MSSPPRTESAPRAEPVPSGEPRRIAGGFTVPEYEERVWDMAKHQLHPTAIYVVAAVAGFTRLASHARFDEPGFPWTELAFFACVFLGAWACFWSTMLRVAGLGSLTITLLVPAEVLAAVAVWTIFPAPSAMSGDTLLLALALLAAPGPPTFLVTWHRWRTRRREILHLLPEADR